MIIFNDIKSAMRFINNSNQDLIIRKNIIYNHNNEQIGIVNLK